MTQMAIILAAVIISLGYMQFVADAKPLVDKSTKLKPVIEPPIHPGEDQQVDFTGDVNAILEEKMLLNPLITSNRSAGEQKQPKLPTKIVTAILEENNLTPNNLTPNNLTASNITFREMKLLQSTNKKTNSDIYSISIYNSSNLSEFLVDGNGTALYYFKGDLRGSGIICTGACLEQWRPFYTPVIIVMPGLNQSDFTTFTGAIGIKQIAYKGWPLYHYANDTMPGDAKGQGFDGAWFVIDPRDFPPR